MADAKGLVVAGGLFEGAAGVVEPKVGVLPQAVVVGGAAEAKGFENGEVDFGASGAPKMLVVCSGAKTESVKPKRPRMRAIASDCVFGKGRALYL